MTNEELIAKIKAEIERRIKIQDDWAGRKVLPGRDLAFAVKEELKQLLSFLSTLESEKPMNMEDAVKWLVDDDYHEASEKGRFILGSVGLGYNGYYIPYLDLLKLPKED